MPTPRLLKKNTLLITRWDATTGGYDADGEYVEPDKDEALNPFPVQGSLQPYSAGKTKVELPEGVRANDARVFYTVARLLTSDDAVDQKADITFIDNAPYELFHVEDWYSPAFRTAHYKCVFIRQEKMNGYQPQ